MTNELQTAAPPHNTLAQLIDQHGLWRILRAAIRVALDNKRAARIRLLTPMSDHLRRDIGLGDQPEIKRPWPPPF